MEQIKKEIISLLKANINKPFTDWDTYLEYIFIPIALEMKYYYSEETKVKDLCPNINLSRIVELTVHDGLLKHILNYLNNVGVRVSGQIPSFYLENYDYVLARKLEIKKYRMLCSNDEALIQKYISTNDNNYRDEIILNNVGLVKYLAYRVSKITNSDYESLLSTGYEALINAVDKYKGYIRITLKTYLYNEVRNEIIKEAIAKEKFNVIDSIDVEMVTDQDDAFENTIDNKAIYEKLMHNLDVLNNNQKLVLLEFLNLGKNKKTQTEIAKKYGLSYSRVRSLNAQSLKKLRNPENVAILNKTLEDFDEINLSYSAKSLMRIRKI